ncbi:MAG: winged helix-turn-helix domain-containing protein, partial [Thaumarchaeota archaeon]|nr:winged helix-turn-helix domain-containing protein [Nitrososphaerota archaeon]
GYLTQTFTRQQYVMKGRDAFDNPVLVPPDPRVRDEMERAKTVVYSLTPRALEWFAMRVGPSKMGDPKHVRVIEKLLKEEYWPLGYYCVVDWGETSVERPDIAVLKPAPKTVKDKMGNDQRISNPHVWDYTTATAVEIEMSPLKSKVQLLKNYHKNKDAYEQIRFVVTSLNHEHELRQILGEDQPADPVKYRVDVMEFETLNTIAPRPQEESKEPEEPSSSNQEQVNAEERILSYIKEHGFTTREEIAAKCREVGIEIGARQVSRYLKTLTDKGLLRREGRRYVPTEPSRDQKRLNTL